MLKNTCGMTETLANGYSSESTRRELSNEYWSQGLDGFQKSLSPCALDKSNLSIGRLIYYLDSIPVETDSLYAYIQ